MNARIYIRRDEITPALREAAGFLRSPNMMDVGNTAKAIIVSRTQSGESLEGGAFPGYSTERYYAPVKKRPPGYPAPSGGRRTALRGGRKLRSVVYDGGYCQYKAAMGFGSEPQLSVSHSMLSDIQVTVVGPTRVMLFFGDRLSANKAHQLHHGKYPFFGLQQAERVDLYGELARRMRALRGVS